VDEQAKRTCGSLLLTERVLYLREKTNSINVCKHAQLAVAWGQLLPFAQLDSDVLFPAHRSCRSVGDDAVD
jgi:hypothetical protein